MDVVARVKVRTARPDELEVVQALNAASFANDAPHDPYLVMGWPHDPATGGAYFADRLQGSDGRGVILVAEADDGSVVGYLAGALQLNETYRRGTRSELENMCVQAGARRGGIGSALIEAFVAWSREQGADEVYVSAYFDNAAAVACYQRNGFRSYAHDLLLDLR